MISANIYTSAPHYQIFHNKKLEFFKSIIFVIPQVTQCPIGRFSPLKQKRNTKYLLYFLHLSIQISYIIPICYTLIVNTLQTKTSDAPHNTLKNMPSKRWQTSLSILTIFSLKYAKSYSHSPKHTFCNIPLSKTKGPPMRAGGIQNKTTKTEV